MGNELHLDEFVIKNHKVTEEGVFAYLVSAVYNGPRKLDL